MKTLLLADIQIGPSDFAAWSDEIEMCACALCSAANQSRPLDFEGRWRLIACLVLLEALKEGRHQHRSYSQTAADAKARAIATGIYGRPVIKVSLAFAQTGTGAAMTPGGVR